MADRLRRAGIGGIPQELTDSIQEDVLEALKDLGMTIDSDGVERHSVIWKQFKPSAHDGTFEEDITPEYYPDVEVASVVSLSPNDIIMSQLGWAPEADILVFLSKKDLDEKSVTVGESDTFEYNGRFFKILKLLPVYLGYGIAVAYVISGKEEPVSKQLDTGTGTGPGAGPFPDGDDIYDGAGNVK